MAKPLAILKSLEDCPDWLDRTLLIAYRNADYWLQPLEFPEENWRLFRFDAVSHDFENTLKLFDIQSFTIITAYNPGSVLLPEAENLARHARLREILTPQCRFLRKSVSQAPGGDWQEPGFWALDLDLDLAVELGRHFGQSAIVCWQRGEQPALWWL